MTLLTAEQHRILASNLLKTAGRPGHRSKKQAEQQASHHQNMALMIEHRAELKLRQAALAHRQSR
jgi:hypothetical protein